jgi:Leucine-rich repeat (LRR) protein
MLPASVRVVDSAFNDLIGNLSVVAASKLPALEYMDLQNNDIVGDFPDLSPSIKYVDVSGNRLNDILSPNINLQGNEMQGTLPPWDTFNCDSLTQLLLSKNRFSGQYNHIHLHGFFASFA